MNRSSRFLFARYETLLQQAHYVETPAPDPMTPWPPLGPIAELGRLRLAISFRTDPTAVFLREASQELAFWRMTLREAQLLGTKMSALAAIRWANDFLSTLMRERQLDAGDLARLRGFVRPFTTRGELISAPPSSSESRTSLLGGHAIYVAGDASWVVRLLLQKNATFNQEFRDTIEPMRLRSSLDSHGSTTTARHTSHCHMTFHCGARHVLQPWRQAGAEQVDLGCAPVSFARAR